MDQRTIDQVDERIRALADPNGTDAALLASLPATYVSFKNFDGTAVTGKHVQITLTADGTDISDIQVVTP